MVKDARAWVVANRSGHLIASTVRQLRKESIIAMAGDGPMVSRSWAYWKRQGCRCIRVRLVPEADSGGDRG